MELLVSDWSPLVAKLIITLWFGSENQSEIVVLSQLNHVFVVKHNNKFKQIRNAWHLGFESALVFTAQWFR
ncbi:hypothetical protein [Vibrio ouci]|uniref:hypothetical protein n=1 Tax=Vibrio ouci TaxID=2499078 RepID=UPI00142E816C|nr:hypothetical protein [Vibrio ouci]